MSMVTRESVDKGSPLALGVSEDPLILFRNHPAFEVKAMMSNEDMRVVVSYPDQRIMQSGWLVGEKHLRRRAPLIDAKMGRGRVVLFGFSPQFRAQTDATFKFFFNCLLG